MTPLPLPVSVHYCFSRADLRRVERLLRCRQRLEWPARDVLGCVHWVTPGSPRSRSRAAIICIGDLSGVPPATRLATLVHECVHVWQDVLDYIGEDAAGAEMEAYSIDALFEGLYKAWSARPAVRAARRPPARARKARRSYHGPRRS